MDSINVNTEQHGNIRISDDVIATIASIATKEVEGISGLSLSIAEELTSKFVKKIGNKAVKVIENEDELTIDINVVVKYGTRIPDVSWEVQENVKKSVESMTGLNVSKVNIIVSGVDFDNSETQSGDEKENK